MRETTGTRRECLAGLAIPVVGALVGCGGVLGEDDTSSAEPYDHLRDEQVHVADSVSTPVPESIGTVDTPANADVVVLPATTDRSAATAVDWIEAGKRVTLVGHRSQGTWLGWQDSEAYAEAYPDHRGRAESCAGSSSGIGGAGTTTECEPPELLVAWEPAEGPPTTYRRTWAGTDDPSGVQAFGGIDDAFDGTR